MASLRSGASSLLNRLSKSLLLHSNKNPNPQSQLLLPSLSRLPGAISPQNDAEFPHTQGFLYPCGLPSLRFFLPQGTLPYISNAIFVYVSCIGPMQDYALLWCVFTIFSFLLIQHAYWNLFRVLSALNLNVIVDFEGNLLTFPAIFLQFISLCVI